MIVELEERAPADAVARITTLAASLGARPATAVWANRTMIVITGCPDGAELEFERMPAVSRVIYATGPTQLASWAVRPAGSVVNVAGVAIGDGGFTVAAGPCAVESGDQLRAAARAVRGAGAAMLRGGAVKPRTSPYTFQGLGLAGFELLREERGRTGLRVVTEVMDPRQVEVTAAHADMLQIGSRNMHNFDLLREVGRGGRPVLLKRGMSATIQEWLLAAEHIMAAGNPDVVLCERGIRTFEPATRFTLDLAAIPVVKQHSHLPVLVDPSHALGAAYGVPSMMLAAAAAGADGLLVDVHPEPAAAQCDGGQALLPADFSTAMAALHQVLNALGRRLAEADTQQTEGRRSGGRRPLTLEISEVRENTRSGGQRVIDDGQR